MSSSPPTDATPCEICGDDPRWVTPYCQHVTPVVGGITAVQPREQRTKAEVLAEYDQRMAAALAGVAPVNPKGTPGAPQAGTSPEVPAVRKKRKATRRTSAQVQRAAEQVGRELALKETQATRGTVLEGQTEHEDQWLADLRRS